MIRMTITESITVNNSDFVINIKCYKNSVKITIKLNEIVKFLRILDEKVKFVGKMYSYKVF